MDDGSVPVIRRLGVLAAFRRPEDLAFAEFLPAYYHELPEFDVDERRDEDLYTVASTHFRIGRRRAKAETIVEVHSPDRERDGWHSERSVVFMITDDAPFLVDTVRIVLERHSVATHLLVHPVLSVRRGQADDLTAVLSDSEPHSGVLLEAWTQVEIDRRDTPASDALRRDLAEAIDSVHRVVADFAAMRARMRLHAELDPLLDWFADGHFVFLGVGTYDLGPDGPICRPGSTLGQLSIESPLDPEIPVAAPTGPSVSIARSSRVASVHRPSRMTAVTVIRIENGEPMAERFVGLLASTAYRQSVLAIPTVGDRARAVLGLASAGAETHTGRSMRNVLETLPRDLVFELDADQLALLVIDVVGLQERQIVRVFDVPEPVGTSSTVMVFLPKSRFTAQLPERVAQIVAACYGSSVRDLESLIGSSNLARVTLTVDRIAGSTPDLDALSDDVDRLTTSWLDRVHQTACVLFGEHRASELVRRAALHASAGYQAAVDPSVAVADLERLVAMLDSGAMTRAALARENDADDGVWRLRVSRRGAPIALSDLLPLLGFLGLHALDEHPYEFALEGEPFFIYDIGVQLPSGIELDDARHSELLAALVGLLEGHVEADGFNRLIVIGGLTAGQTDVLRCYAKYAHQTGLAFSRSYVQECLARLPRLAMGLIELFEAKFDPDRDAGSRPVDIEVLDQVVADLLDQVPSLDDDRIGRMFLALIRATVRTSAYQGRQTLAFKLDPSQVPDLPAPRPKHEIFVCSPRVEGVHLRGGAIARGGLRWSDRPEDYRTEVLGLVKAQMVKNAVIVPVGAKGGFVVKRPKSTPAENRDEVIDCYRMFVRGLLDVTDNVIAGVVVPPERTVRYDGDDAYLVVAADKGTATFSDTANQIAADYHFWLGDAFASGGSAGYDHKAMAITARGAWESVRRHAAFLGKNADTDELTVVGIGDMSGDVFGNGLLRSPHLKLVAAFDHRHVFLDPNPDPVRSFVERRRLFETPRSSWAEYDPTLISVGGGVSQRTVKSIALSSEVRQVLGIEDVELAPTDLIRAILRAPVDMLWSGGVGTYVKASTESHAQVGDRASDAVRVDGRELRCQMVVEGGNLGCTQLARVEYALAGGLIHTDAIDNSAGVDCSDHEVNIKILLSEAVAAEGLTMDQRNDLLVSMTDEVGELVLDNNRAQTLALMIARRQALPMVNVHARYLDQLEREGWLDRALEFLPTDKQLAERQSAGAGLQTPEFAVLIAYTKNVNVGEVLRTDLPDSPMLEPDLVNYFPTALRDRYRPLILGHRLRREIAATQLVNQMVNLSGISYDHRMTEDTGASVTDVTRAWFLAREVLGFDQWWDEINELKGVELDHQLELFLDCRRTAERCSLWFLRHRRPPLDLATEIERFRDPIRELATDFVSCLKGPMRSAVTKMTRTRRGQGFGDHLAERSAVWRLIHTTFDMIELAERSSVRPAQAATAYWSVFDRLELMWLWDGIGALPRADRWQTQARGSLRDDLMSALAELAENALEHGSVDAWLTANERSVQRTVGLLTEIRRGDHLDITNLSVALRQLRNLALTSVRE